MKLISIVMALFISNLSLANCNLPVDIIPKDNGNREGFWYSNECHQEVGKAFMDRRDLNEQILTYEDLLNIHDEQLMTQEELTDSWKETSYELKERVNNLDKANDKNKMLYFGLGIAVTIGSAWALSQVSK